MKKTTRKKIANKKNAFFSWAAKKVMRQLFTLVRLSKNYNYETVEVGGKVYPGVRDCDQRWSMIRRELEHYGAGNVLDIGCSESRFVRLCAGEMGCFSFGVDSDKRRLWLGALALMYDEVDHCAVMKGRLDAVSIRRLPHYDVCLCLSVVHHVIKEGGIEAAREFVKAIASVTRKAIIFEMGTAEEKAMDWADMMPDMRGDQCKYMEHFLSSCDLQNVRLLGGTQSIKKDAVRFLFAAEPNGAGGFQV